MSRSVLHVEPKPAQLLPSAPRYEPSHTKREAMLSVREKRRAPPPNTAEMLRERATQSSRVLWDYSNRCITNRKEEEGKSTPVPKKPSNKVGRFIP